MFTPVFGGALTQKLMGDGYHPEIKPDNGFSGILFIYSVYPNTLGNDYNVVIRMLQNDEKSWFVKRAGGTKIVLIDAIRNTILYLKTRLGKWGE